MRGFRDISIGVKLPVMIVTMVLISTVIADVVAYRQGRAALIEAGTQSLALEV